MEQSFVCSNKESRDRLLAIVENLDDATLQQQISDEWTIAATLAHVAFWDQICVARWDAYDARGSLHDLPDATIDLVNVANLPTWLALPTRSTVGLVRRSMEDLDDRIAALSEDAQWAAADGFIYMLDRTRHRNKHSAEIEANLN